MHGPETVILTQRSLASLSGQDWVGDKLTDDDKSAVEMTVMFLVALAARNDEGFERAVAAFRARLS